MAQKPKQVILLHVGQLKALDLALNHLQEDPLRLQLIPRLVQQLEILPMLLTPVDTPLM